MLLLSILIPMKNEAECLDVLFSRLAECLAPVSEDYEIICVDDGSTDDTYAALQAHHAKDARIKAIRLSRNFGKESALCAALDHAQGDAVIPIDADLQDPPELIADMVAEWREGYKVVLACRRSRREDGLFKRQTAGWFYRVLNWTSRVHIPENTGDFRLMDRQVVEAIKTLPERTRFSKGLFAWVGFDTTTLYFDRPQRSAGTTKWNLRRLWGYALDGIFAFSSLPLRVWTYIGAVIALVSFTYAGFIILRTLFFGTDVPGYASLLVAVLFMGGIQLVSLGIIGEYVGRIYREVKHRPIYIASEMLGVDKPRL